MTLVKYISLGLVLLSSITIIMSCGDDDEPARSPEEQFQEYFAANNISPQQTASGLYYVIDVPGSTEKPTRSSAVTVTYKGYFLDGEVFDSNDSLEFSLRSVISGWTEGIPLFGIGGRGTLYVPSQLGYGPEGRGSIPGNTPLIFEIELFSFR